MPEGAVRRWRSTLKWGDGSDERREVSPEKRRALTRRREAGATASPAGYQEASCVDAVTSYKWRGRAALIALSLARHATSSKKATLKTMLSAELDTVLGRRPDLQVVTVAGRNKDVARQLMALSRRARHTTKPPRWSGLLSQPPSNCQQSALDARYGENELTRGRAAVPQACEHLRASTTPKRSGEGDSSAELSKRKKFPRRTRIGGVLRY